MGCMPIEKRHVSFGSRLPALTAPLERETQRARVETREPSRVKWTLCYFAQVGRHRSVVSLFATLNKPHQNVWLFLSAP